MNHASITAIPARPRGLEGRASPSRAARPQTEAIEFASAALEHDSWSAAHAEEDGS